MSPQAGIGQAEIELGIYLLIGNGKVLSSHMQPQLF